MAICKNCGRDFEYELHDGKCQKCIMDEDTRAANCKRCGKILIASEITDELCASCKRNFWYWAKKGATGLVVVIGIVLTVAVGKNKA